MSAKSGIEWTDATWNPVRGCSRISEGCRHCYAEEQAARIVRMAKGKPSPYDGLVRTVDGEARWTGVVRLVVEHLADPLRWKKGRKIFVNSMSDLFHDKLTNEEIAAVFGVMAAAPQHTFQILTKRPDRMAEWFEWLDAQECPPFERDRWELLDEIACGALAGHFDCCHLGLTTSKEICWPLPNVWLGTSIEDQETADLRVPFLLETPAAVRFVSYEPALGPVNLFEYLDPAAAPCGETTATLDWVIAGCESGKHARPAEANWFRTVRDQCASERVPFFLKQAKADATGILAPYAAPPDIIKCVSPFDRTRFTDAVIEGPGSKRKAGGVIALPYLDGVQHAAFPRTA